MVCKCKIVYCFSGIASYIISQNKWPFLPISDLPKAATDDEADLEEHLKALRQDVTGGESVPTNGMLCSSSHLGSIEAPF